MVMPPSVPSNRHDSDGSSRFVTWNPPSPVMYGGKNDPMLPPQVVTAQGPLLVTPVTPARPGGVGPPVGAIGVVETVAPLRASLTSGFAVWLADANVVTRMSSP
jgi:hypothetical protein